MDLSAAIHLLGDLLGQVITEQESPETFALEEQIRTDAKERRSAPITAADETVTLVAPELALPAGERLAAQIKVLDPVAARAVAAAFSLYFDLVNTAEEQSRVQALRQQEQANYPQPVRESVADAVATLRQQGLTPEQMAHLLENLEIELVLTAHPTEARRRTILSKINRIAGMLEALSLPGMLPREQQAYRQELYREITAFWLTERARTARPSVTDEARTGLYFIDRVFWDVLPRIYTDLDQAVREYFPELEDSTVATASRPWLRLASWVGGDRDGNPNVTTPVTAETLRLHRGLAVEKHRAAFQELARQLSISARQTPPPAALLEWFESRRPLPPHVAFLEQRYAREPYRLALALLAADLAEASQDDMTARLLSNAPYHSRLQTDEFSGPLQVIRETLPEAMAGGGTQTVQRQLEIFGLHSARLDLREDSEQLNAALGEVLRALDLDEDAETCQSFALADSEARLRLLNRLLTQPSPPLAPHPGVTPAGAEIWALFQLIARSRAVYGEELLGPFIISMTRSAADVLAVLLLARWTGADQGMQITPLFETVADLQAAPHILTTLFTLPVYREHLDRCSGRQMVMIGYSDSNKDAGYLAANWALYQAQEEIASICRQHGVTLTLFHGRGGTVARGGGPANQAIRAQPPGTIAGRFRLTEQGEIIAARYANPDIAHRHLSQLIHAVLLASAPDGNEKAPPAAWREAMMTMAALARYTYRELVYSTAGFLDFWQAATPLDEIRRLHIGSRPTARKAGAQVVTQIRAIPWVFSWMQSRYNLPGWFGLGSGLESAAVSPELLREMYAGWSFFRTLLDNAEMSLLKADMEIAELYAGLAPDKELARRIYGLIQDEYKRTRQAVLGVSGHSELLENAPLIQRSIRLRNPYVDPLNYLQVEMLGRIRSLSDPDGPQAEPLREVMVLTINGIAAGLRNTG